MNIRLARQLSLRTVFDLHLRKAYISQQIGLLTVPCTLVVFHRVSPVPHCMGHSTSSDIAICKNRLDIRELNRSLSELQCLEDSDIMQVYGSHSQTSLHVCIVLSR